MIKDLRWCLPGDDLVYVERYGPGEYVVDHIYGDGGHQLGPFPTRRAAREAALELIARISHDRGRPH